MNILQAIEDQSLFGPFLGEEQSTWQQWFVALSAVYGIKVHPSHTQLVADCTGRQRRLLPADGFDTAVFLTGRRSGKSRMAAVIGAYEAALAGREHKLAKGEKGVVAICAPTTRQSRIVREYIRALFDPPLLHGEIVAETADSFELANGIRIETLAGDWRTVRGFTLVAAVIDEACFFGLDAESKVRSDTELVRALKPALATCGGRLVAISTPYARRGWCFSQYKRHFGNDNGRVLVWNCPSRTMNPSLPQSVVDEALAEDLQAAKAEYLGEWRDDVAEFVPRSLIEGLVQQGRKELLPRSNVRYLAFVDMSGGRADDAACAIGHLVERKVVIDLLRRYKAPFNPHEIITLMAEQLRQYAIHRVTGDAYAAEFTARAFEAQGIGYVKSDKPASQLYLELLPRLCSGEIELPDNELLVDQLAGLERRTRSGGRDIIDHRQGAHDDLANVVAGVADIAAAKTIRIGAL